MAYPLAPLQRHPSGLTGTCGRPGMQLPRTSLGAHNFPLPRLLSSLLTGMAPVHSSNLKSGVTPWSFCLPIMPRSALVKSHHCWCGQVQCPASPNSLVCKMGVKTSCDHVAGLCQLTCAKYSIRDLRLCKFSTNDCRCLLLTHWVRNLQRVVQILAVRGYSVRVWKWMSEAWEGNSLVEWDGEGRVLGVQVGGDVGEPMADSCWCLVESNAIL